MGVMPPRTQDLVVLYHAEGGEICQMWIAPDRENLGGDRQATREQLEATEAFVAFRKQVEELSEGAQLDVHFNDYLEEY